MRDAPPPSEPDRPDPPAVVPGLALRASDADRERTAELLRGAGGDGRLTMDELDDRLHAAYGAITHADLDALVTDLVPAGGAGRAVAAAVSRRVTVREGDDATAWLVAVMGGTGRHGRWRVGRRCRAIAVMGGTELDLTEAEFGAHDVYLDVVSVMGGAEVRVPEHMNVRVSKLALMGGHDVRLGTEEPDPGGPVLHLRLISVMGGAEVRRGARQRRRSPHRIPGHGD